MSHFIATIDAKKVDFTNERAFDSMKRKIAQKQVTHCADVKGNIFEILPWLNAKSVPIMKAGNTHRLTFNRIASFGIEVAN